MPCLEPVLMMRPAPALDHARGEHLRTMNQTPEIDGKNALPVLQGAEHLAARLNAGVVHQDIGAAEPFSHGAFEFRHLFDAADVHRLGHDIGGAVRCRRRQFCLCLSETVATQIRDAHLHAKAGEPHRGGKTDAGRASGDDGDIVRRHGWVGHVGSPDLVGLRG